jgi:hypothetical protein
MTVHEASRDASNDLHRNSHSGNICVRTLGQLLVVFCWRPPISLAICHGVRRFRGSVF